jgi:mono/diheme cytochrome c family protein
VARGRTRYEVVCVPCHGNHPLRRGPLLSNQRWTPPRIRQRVREGNSSMPAIPVHRLDEDDLEALLAYFTTTGVCITPDDDVSSVAVPPPPFSRP